MRHGWRIFTKYIARENLHLTVSRLRRCAEHKRGAMWLSGVSECERSETRRATRINEERGRGVSCWFFRRFSNIARAKDGEGDYFLSSNSTPSFFAYFSNIICTSLAISFLSLLVSIFPISIILFFKLFISRLFTARQK
jgi:hypothetical protein